MSTVSIILMILTALAVNWPVLMSVGMELSKAILLVVNPGQGKAVADYFHNSLSTYVDEFIKEQDLCDVLATTNSGFVVYRYHQFSRSKAFAEDLIDIGESGTYGGTPVNAPILIISEGFPLGVSREDLFTICLDVDIKDLSPVDINEVVPEDEDLPVVAAMIKSFTDDITDRDQASLTAAACFCAACMDDEEREEYFPELLSAISHLIDTNFDVAETEDTGDLVLDEMLRWREKYNFSDAYELPYLTGNVIRNLNRVILYDKEYVYVSEPLFKDMIKPLIGIFPIMKIMESLSENGYLDCNSEKVFTSRIGYYDPDKGYHRTRMLRFARWKLKKFGDEPFLEQCIYAQEEKNYEED